MAQKQWAGLVTDASPYVLAPGASVEQVNLSTAIPGQLTSRGGMRAVVFGEDDDTAPEEIRDLLPYATPTDRALLALTSEGSLVLLISPHAGPAPTAPVTPAVTANGEQVASNYVGQFALGPQAPD